MKTVKLKTVKKNQPTTVEITKSDVTTGVELDGAKLTVLDKEGNVQRLKLTFAGIRKSKRQPLSAFRMKPLETGYVHSL